MLQRRATRDYKLSVTVASCYINVVFLLYMCIVLNCHMVIVCTIIIKDYYGNRELYKFSQLLPQARYY